MDTSARSPSRWVVALVAAALVAVAVTTLLAFAAPMLAGSSFSALPYKLTAAFLLVAVVLPFAIMLGIAGAVSFLGPAFLVATFFQSNLRGYMAAGALAGLGHTALSAMTRPSSPRGFGPFWWLGTQLMPWRADWSAVAAIALATMAAGVCAGLLFGNIFLPREQRTVPRWIRPRIVVPTLSAIALGAFWIFHDPVGDRPLCPHTDHVRVAIGATRYDLPANLHPRFSEPAGAPPLNIFRAFDHRGSRAAWQAKDSIVYCQAAQDARWRIEGFEFNPRGNSPIPSTVTAFSINKKQPRQADAPPVMVEVDRRDAGLGWVPGDGLLSVWPDDHMNKSRPPHGRLTTQLADGTWLVAKIQFDPKQPQAALPQLRAIGRFLVAYGASTRP